VQTGQCLSAEQLYGKGLRVLWGKIKHGSTEMLAAKRPPAPWVVRTEAEPGDPGKDTPLLGTH